MKVAIFSTKYYEKEYLDHANLENKHDLTYFEESLNIHTVSLAAGYEAVSVMLLDDISEETIEALSLLGTKVITLRSAGFDNVDLEAAEKFHMKVMRVPAYSPQAIAEHAVALIQTLNRKTHKAYNRVRENNFSIENLMGFNLFGKTVGVVGTGKIGRAFCNIMLGFGCKIVAYDIKENLEMKLKGVEYKSFELLLLESDIISIHCPLTDDTRHLFNKTAFDLMLKGTMLINTSRGAVINTLDAIEALKDGHLGFLGIDVYEGEEKIFFKDLSDTVVKDDTIERLMSFNNVLITPHLAFFTNEAVRQIAEITLQNISDFEREPTSRNEIIINLKKTIIEI
ncbi:2-hydroxyacid dehydrogenase [Lacihabitans sp. LS3-19]|uniref:2-hydroxyacid dehydrogenase n=1 Tax=Lacihabitans sp. LS3-19 TaxID=2487335 RepID=UPI0020CD84F0|nr:2-hydroxyacid dehydrogenase [Lacihabitans sp. LS3-19]MCP9767034.1 2-hydroxyacid dehydrogenase [Lacihabitans sp. LS3-19]